MKTLVVKNHRPLSASAHTEYMLSFRNINSIEKVPTHEVDGSRKYRITFHTTCNAFSLHNLGEAESALIMENVLAFNKALSETLTITLYPDTNPDMVVIEES